ncbi:hypothetical protein AMECASPLE_038498 [Ameca splendens]|uniref:Uncharacterized protein n=1 Tax=Ameca splendens TaxID=208324 RepID=A0ABV0YKH8_9TELE
MIKRHTSALSGQLRHLRFFRLRSNGVLFLHFCFGGLLEFYHVCWVTLVDPHTLPCKRVNKLHNLLTRNKLHNCGSTTEQETNFSSLRSSVMYLQLEKSTSVTCDIHAQI